MVLRRRYGAVQLKEVLKSIEPTLVEITYNIVEGSICGIIDEALISYYEEKSVNCRNIDKMTFQFKIQQQYL